MSLIIDFLLLSASGAACFYCWILSKRLKALTNTKDGFQTGIAALSQSAEDMQAAMTKTQQEAAQLEVLLAEADKKMPELQGLLGQITDITSQAVNDTETASKNLVDMLSPHIQEARSSAQLLLQSLEQASQSAGEQTKASTPAQEIIEPKKEEEKETAKKGQGDADDEEIEFISIGDDNDEEPQGAAA